MAKKRTLYTICTVVFMVGIALFVFNAENIKYNSFFNEDSVSDRANEMRRNYSILGYSFDSTTRDLYKEIYAKDANSGNTAIMGIAICIVSSVIAIIVYMHQTQKNREKYALTQYELYDKLSGENKKSTESQLSELLNLKNKGLISEEEYQQMRDKALYRF